MKSEIPAVSPRGFRIRMSSILFPLLLLVLATCIFFIFVRPSISLAPWVPTRKKDLEKINEIASLKPGARFYDLGCGDGVVAAYIAKHNPEVFVVGVELSPLMYLAACIRVRFSGLRNIDIRFGNALHVDLQDAQVVYAFGLPNTINQKLKPKLDRELLPGARFISYTFGVEDTGVGKVTTPYPSIHLCSY